MSFFRELKRRNVIRVAAGYIVLAWLVVQVVETIFPAFGFGDEAIRFVVIGFAVGFIPVVVAAWVFEWTPQGIRKDDGIEQQGPAVAAAAKRWDRIVMIILAAAVAFFIVENYLERPIDVEPTVAVIPFAGIGVDQELEYLPISVAEGIHASVARVPELVVSAWPTALKLWNEGMDAEKIAERLEAPSFLDGTVQVVGDRVRIVTRLVASDSGRTIWSATFDETMEATFAIQDEIARAIVTNLIVEQSASFPRAQQTNSETYRLTTQAWSILNRESQDNVGTIASALLDEALALDPDYLPALNGLSMAAFNRVLEGLITEEEAQEIYQAVEEKVLAVDPDNGLQNMYLAWTTMWERREFAHSNHHLQVAMRTGLNDLEVLRILAGFARRTGHIHAAVWFGERTMAVDPTCENCQWQHSENLFYAGRFAEAIETKKRLQKIISGGYYNHAVMLLKSGDPQGALEVVAEPGRREQSPGILAMAYHALGETEKFANAVAILEQLEGNDPYITLAEVYAFTGDTNLAFEALEKAIEQGESLQYNLFLPQWDSLRDDARWAKLRERLDMSEEHLSSLDFSAILRNVP